MKETRHKIYRIGKYKAITQKEDERQQDTRYRESGQYKAITQRRMRGKKTQGKGDW